MTILMGLTITLVMFAFLIVGGIREFYLFKIRMFAISRASYFVKRVIDEANTDYGKARWHEMYDILENYPNHDSMFWNLQAWKYEDFYVNFESKLRLKFDEILIGIPNSETTLNIFNCGRSE